MKKEEFQKRQIEINKVAKKAYFDLGIEYAKSNNSVKVGDIVVDHYQTIKVEKIIFCSRTVFSSVLPCCMYKGIFLTKAGTPYKTGKTGIIHQCNLKNINGESYE